MKLRTIRFSGLPVSPENLKQYNEEWKSAYDAILEQHGQDMLTVHQKVEQLEKDLQAKYVQIESNKLPASKKAWVKLLESFDAPIMLARSSEDPNELLLVVMDQPLG